MSTSYGDPYVGRFAPSPTGPLHFGSMVAALASYLDAKAHNGQWLVRIEDVDETRCKSEFADDILRTLLSFGLQWDGEVLLQSQRKPAYEQALARLSSQSHIYACGCSRKEIADSATAGIEGPVYPGTCRYQPRHQPIDRRAVPHAIRVLTHNDPIIFTDSIQDEYTQRIESAIGDFIIKRRDGLFAYQLAVVVDDAAQGITHVVRGADLIDSTARQIHLQHLLALPTPRYLHIPVVTNAAGQKLSKQTLAAGIPTVSVNRVLIHALTHLQQTTAALTEQMPTSRLLQLATAHWQIATIPKARAIPLLEIC